MLLLTARVPARYSSKANNSLHNTPRTHRLLLPTALQTETPSKGTAWPIAGARSYKTRRRFYQKQASVTNEGIQHVSNRETHRRRRPVAREEQGSIALPKEATKPTAGTKLAAIEITESIRINEKRYQTENHTVKDKTRLRPDTEFSPFPLRLRAVAEREDGEAWARVLEVPAATPHQAVVAVAAAGPAARAATGCRATTTNPTTSPPTVSHSRRRASADATTALRRPSCSFSCSCAGGLTRCATRGSVCWAQRAAQCPAGGDCSKPSVAESWTRTNRNEFSCRFGRRPRAWRLRQSRVVLPPPWLAWPTRPAPPPCGSVGPWASAAATPGAGVDCSPGWRGGRPGALGARQRRRHRLRRQHLGRVRREAMTP